MVARNSESLMAIQNCVSTILLENCEKINSESLSDLLVEISKHTLLAYQLGYRHGIEDSAQE